jgi:hypothetical protein
MAILNLQTLTPKAPEEELLEGVPGLNISPLPSGIDLTPPPPDVPRFRGYGDFLAQRGGFAPEDLRTREELMGMTQAEVDEYQRQRRQARRAGIGETLLRVGQAFQGKDATALAMQREQARQQAELQRGYQEQYQSAIQTAEQVDPGKAALLRSLGLPGWLNLQQKQAEQMFLGGKRENVEIYELVDKDNTFIKNITESEWLQQSRAGTLPKGSKLQNLGTGTRAADSPSEALDKKFEPVLSGFIASEQLIDGLSKTSKIMYENPQVANNLVAGGAKAYSFLESNIEGFGSLVDRAKKTDIYTKTLETKKSDTGRDWSKEINDLVKATNISESRILDMAFALAAAKGQEGRSLSDRDFQNAIDMLSKGFNAEQKIALFGDVANRIITNFEIQRRGILSINPDFKSKYDALGNLTPFVNPYEQQNIDPLGIR